MDISIDELRKFNGDYEWFKRHGDGYRIVYFYKDKHYYIGAYCKTIEGFMFDFCDNYPVMDESDIPSFVSIDDLLNRYLNDLTDVSKVALYKTDGTCLATKERIKNSAK